MSITYPLTLPAAPAAPARIRLKGSSIVAVSSSPFTAQQEIYQHQGQFWTAEVSLPTLGRADAEPWLAFLLSLNGRYGTFRMGDPAGATPRGIATGTPLVKGAGQTGQSMVTDGWTPSTAGILKVGDYIQVGDYLYKVLKDVTSDSGGNATLDIWPRLRSAPADNASITTSNATGLFRLATNEMPWDEEPGPFYNIAFQAIEAI